MKKLFIISLIIASCSKPNIQRTVYVEYFKIGDVLPPDYAINDSLVVVDAYNLNIKMGEIEQGLIEATDYQISKVFYQYCKQFKTK